MQQPQYTPRQHPTAGGPDGISSAVPRSADARPTAGVLVHSWPQTEEGDRQVSAYVCPTASGEAPTTEVIVPTLVMKGSKLVRPISTSNVI